MIDQDESGNQERSNPNIASKSVVEIISVRVACIGVCERECAVHRCDFVFTCIGVCVSVIVRCIIAYQLFANLRV